MGTKQIVLSGKAFVKLLEQLRFADVRVNGSHHRMKHGDGRMQDNNDTGS